MTLRLKDEYLKQLEQADSKIKTLDARRLELSKRREQLNVDQTGELKRIREELSEVEGAISDLTLLRNKAKEQLKKWVGKGSVTEKLVQQCNALYEEGRSIVDYLIKTQAEVGLALKKLPDINAKMSRLDNVNLEATGEHLNQPNPIIVFQAMAFAASNIPPIKPLPPWRYVSDTERLARFQAEQEEQRKRHQELMAIANEKSPDCARCGEKTAVDLRAGTKERPGADISEGHWIFYCKACGNRQIGVVQETKTKS